MKYSKNNEKGRSLLEMMGVIAIILALTIGGLNGYQRAMEKMKVQKAETQIVQITTGIRTLYIQHETYRGLNNQSAVNMQVIPIDAGSTADLISPFRGSIKIGTGRAALSEDITSDRAFYIIYDKLNKMECMDMAIADWGGKETQIIAIGIFGQNTSNEEVENIAKSVTLNYAGYKDDYGLATPLGSVLPIPVPIYEAMRLCDCPKQSLSCKLFWKYY